MSGPALIRSRASRLLACLMLLILAASCTTVPVERRYYTLSMPSRPMPGAPSTSRSLWIREADIAPVINRPQVVYRLTPTELKYYNLELWADRPARMVTETLESTVRSAGIFRAITTRIGASPPEFVLESSVSAMEQLDGGGIWYAHLAMQLRLSRFDNDAIVWQYSFDEQRPVYTREVGLTVRALSDILTDQLERALPEVEAVLTGRPMPRRAGAGVAQSEVGPGLSQSEGAGRATALPAGSGKPARPADHQASGAASPGAQEGEKLAAATVKGEDDAGEVDWTRSPQFTSDRTRVPPGMGAVFLPSLSGEPEREPPVEVYRGEDYVTTGQMGQRIPVPPGSYILHFGSGALSQRITVQVSVQADRVSVIQPDWSTLNVSVVTDTFISFRAPYELIDLNTRELLGVGYGADQEQGEETQIWVLKPGLYKIVQPGASYRTRRNFATVLAVSAQHIPFTLVLDKTTRDFLGAGVVELAEDEVQRDKRWKVQSTLGGDLTWARRPSDSNAQVGTTLGFNAYADNLLRFKEDPHLWSNRLELEEGTSLEGPVDFGPTWWEQSRSVTSADRMYFNSIYMYELRPWLGPYARLGGETLLQNRYKILTPTPEGSIPQVHIANAEGEEVCNSTLSGSALCARVLSDRVLLAGTFSPFELKQGVGVNFRVFHNTSVDLDLRVGLGGRQTLQAGLLRVDENSSTATDVYLAASSNAFAMGPEMTLVGAARLTRYLQATTEFDALFPFSGGLQQAQFSWRTSASARLSSYASLVYNLDLDRNPSLGREEPLVVDQRLLLRFAFNLL